MSDETKPAGIFRELHAAVVPVSDMEVSRLFYEGVLGLTPARVVAGALTVYGTGGKTWLCLYEPDPGGDRPGYDGQGAFPNFRAEDIEVVHEQLLAREVPCTDIESGGSLRWFTFRDPDGNRIDVSEYGPDWLP